MALTDSLERMTETVNALAAALASVAAQPIRVDVVASASRTAINDDLRRQLNPELIELLRKALKP